MASLIVAAEVAAASELVLGGLKNDRGVTVRTTADGGFIVVGVTESRGSGGEDVYLVRLDAEARVLWETAFGGERDDRCFSVAAANDGGFVLAGQTFGYGVTASADGGCAITGHTTRNSAGGLDLFFARVDSGGEAVEGKPLED